MLLIMNPNNTDDKLACKLILDINKLYDTLVKDSPDTSGGTIIFSY